MKNLSVFTLLFVMLCAANACKKDPLYLILDFSQYTATDIHGIQTAPPDTTDWTNDSYWAPAELALFTFNDTAANSTDSVIGNVVVSPAFPNANNGQFAVGLDPERQCKWKYVFVDKELRVLDYGIRRLNGGPTFFTFDFRSATAFDKGDSYRIYYGFYNSKDSLYYKGHGDIKIE